MPYKSEKKKLIQHTTTTNTTNTHTRNRVHTVAVVPMDNNLNPFRTCFNASAHANGAHRRINQIVGAARRRVASQACEVVRQCPCVCTSSPVSTTAPAPNSFDRRVNDKISRRMRGDAMLAHRRFCYTHVTAPHRSSFVPSCALLSASVCSVCVCVCVLCFSEIYLH